jgi:hypothetical protein
MTTSNLTQYSISAIYVNNACLTQAFQISVDRMTNSSIVETLALGYSGESPGAPRTEISISNAVPSADFEFDPGQFMGTLQPVSFSVFEAGRTMTFNGVIVSDNFSQAVNSKATLEFKARGSYATWA